MKFSGNVALSCLGWVAVFAFWLFATSGFHPTRTLSVIVTATLVMAFASAAYINHTKLLPRFRKTKQLGAYLTSLLATMAVSTAIALCIIRVCYLYVFGPYPVNHWYIDFGLDFFGTAVHVALAAIVVNASRRLGVA